MKDTPDAPVIVPTAQALPQTQGYPRPSLGELCRSWELYLVVLAAAFFRLYQLNTTEFDDDQAALFHMASNAVHHGLLVATSNVASLHIYNPPATIYLLMLPAALSTDPLWGTILTALLATGAVVLTYLFVRRYYGRVAATIAALTYATAFRAVVYARFTWNQNFLPLFVVLMIMVLFQGAVARKRGWLAPALLLLGFTLQLHASGIFLAVPLVLGFILAPRTVCKRDLMLGIGLLLVVYAPYLVWEFAVHLADIKLLLHNNSAPAILDGLAFNYYTILLNPYALLSTQNPLHWQIVPFIDEHSYLGKLAPYLAWLSQGALYLLGVCTIMLLAGALWSGGPEKSDGSATPWLLITRYWLKLRASPERCGLLLLLSWQLVPLLLLTRHSLNLYLHYFIVLQPGPFILLGIGLSKLVLWVWTRERLNMPIKRLVRYGVYVLAGALILAQGAASLAGILDLDRGHYNDGAAIPNLYNDLRSLRNAVNAADQLAQEQHLSRVYLSTDWPTQASLRFLSTQMHTPTTLFNDQGCVVLPGVDAGPAAMLVGPYSNFTDALVRQFASATLVSRPPRAGGAPFRLYIVHPQALAPVAHTLLGNSLQLLNAPLQAVTFQKENWLVSQWEMRRAEQAGYRQVYGYTITQQTGQNGRSTATNQCDVTAVRLGDRLLLPLQQAMPQRQGQVPPTVRVHIGTFTIYPYYLKFGPLTFETYKDTTTTTIPLETENGQSELEIPVS